MNEHNPKAFSVYFWGMGAFKRLMSCNLPDCLACTGKLFGTTWEIAFSLVWPAKSGQETFGWQFLYLEGCEVGNKRGCTGSRIMELGKQGVSFASRDSKALTMSL